MDLGTFREWLAGAETRTAEPRQEVCEVFVGRPPEVEVVATIEDRLRDQRRCPHCDTSGAARIATPPARCGAGAPTACSGTAARRAGGASTR